MIHNEATEILPAIPNPYDDPTVQVPRIPGYLWADQEDDVQQSKSKAKQGHSMQEPRDSVIAWPPVVIFLGVFVFYAVVLWFGIVHANEILYVLLIEWQWGR
jgi:hypothetical protein